MSERPPLPPPPAPAVKPPWMSASIVLGTFALALAFAVAVLEGIQWATDWPRWHAPVTLAVLCAVAGTAGRVTRSDRWAVVWDIAVFGWLLGALTFGGHMLIPLSDGFVKDAVVSWGSLIAILLWRRWQVRRGVRESMETPVRHRRERTSA